MEDFPIVVFLLSFLILSFVGVIHLVSDFRLFDNIKTQCEKQGYIQDTHTRILCSVEGDKK